MERARKRRSQAAKMDTLFRNHASDALRLAYLLTGSRELAEDVTQEAFIRVAGRYIDIREPDAFPAYLRRTVVNLTKDHYRRASREQALLRRYRSEPSSQETATSAVEQRQDLIRLLQSLPPRQRAAVILRHCFALSEKDVAEALNTSIPAAKSLISRGLSSLRKRAEAETQ